MGGEDVYARLVRYSRYGPSKIRPTVVAVMVAVDLVVAIFAWRDLKERSEDSIRGSKRFWHLAIVANPGNSIVYWLVGRRRID